GTGAQWWGDRERRREGEADATEIVVSGRSATVREGDVDGRRVGGRDRRRCDLEAPRRTCAGAPGRLRRDDGPQGDGKGEHRDRSRRSSALGHQATFRS